MFTGLLIVIATISSGSTETSKYVKFLGFSKNEAVAAFQVDVARPQSHVNSIDHFKLIRIVNAGDQKLIATFRSGVAKRTMNRGARRSVSAATFEAANPDWAKAMPSHEWQRFKRKARFRGKTLKMDDSTLRLSRDPGMRGEFEAFEKRIEVVGVPGGEVGFQPIARLYDGEFAALGHYGKEGIAGVTWRAQVQVFYSRTGTHVAVLTRFEGDGSRDWQGHVYHLPAAVGTTGIGAVNLSYAGLRVAEDLYKKTHPEYADMYDTYVGRYW